MGGRVHPEPKETTTHAQRGSAPGCPAGGFLARTGDGESGVKIIWLGMQRIWDFAAGVRFSRQLQAAGSCV